MACEVKIQCTFARFLPQKRNIFQDVIPNKLKNNRNSEMEYLLYFAIKK